MNMIPYYDLPLNEKDKFLWTVGIPDDTESRRLEIVDYYCPNPSCQLNEMLLYFYYEKAPEAPFS